MSSIETFTLKDSAGNEHAYVVAKHGGTAGMAVIETMLELGAGPIISALFSSMSVANNGVTGDLKAALGQIDVAAVSESIQKGLRATGGLTKLAPMLLAHTHRDGVLLNPTAIDIAYAANYGELMKALAKVFDINGFFDVLAIFSTDES